MAGMVRMPGMGLGMPAGGMGIGPRVAAVPRLPGMGTAPGAGMAAGVPKVGGGLRLGVPRLKVRPQMARNALLAGMKGPGTAL